MLLRAIISLPVFLLSLTSIHAQTVLVSDPLTIKNDYGYELIGRMRDRILLFRDQYEEFEVQAFDNQMRMSWSKKLEDLENRDLQILAVVPGKNDFSIIFKDRVKSRILLKVHKYDPGANLIDSVIIKDYGERLFTPPVLNFVSSENQNCFAVFNKIQNRELEVTCFVLDKMAPLWDEHFYLSEDFDFIRVRGIVVGNTGEFYILSETNNRRSKLEEHTFHVAEMGQSSKNLHFTFDMPEYYTRDVHFVFDNLNKQVVGAGLYGERNRDKIHGAFLVRFDPRTETLNLHHEPFDERFFSIMRQRDGDSYTKGIADAAVQSIMLRQDGGVVLIGERFHEVLRGTAGGRGMWREAGRSIVDYYYDDLFMIAFYPDGGVHWKTVLHKKQYSQDDDGIFSSFFAFQRPDKLHFLFNDEIRYENTCSEYVVDPLGSFDRNSVLNTVGKGVRLRFRDAIQLNAEECLIPSEFRNKLRLLLLRYNG